MSQLKFVRSKSTIRSTPLGKLQSKLKLVQKPGKLHVSVGRSRQSSQTNEDLIISNPKHKRDYQSVLQLHKINENDIPIQTSDIYQSILHPLSQDVRLINNSRKFSNSSGNIYNKQHYYTQTTCCSPKLSESENIFKFDTLQFKSNKQNSTDQKSISISETNLNSKFNFNQFALNDQCKLQIQNNINTQIKQDYIHQQQNNVILDTHIKKNLVNTKSIQNEDFKVINQNTKLSSRQIPKFFSEILTERSIILNEPKEQKDIEIQTSFSQNNKCESSQMHIVCKSTTNASVQTKSKNKNLGLFEYQLSYLSPKINKNFQESDLISLDDYQQQFIYGNQQEQNNQQLRDIDLNQQLISQKSNINDIDSQYFNLQAEPKEINKIDKKLINNRNISKQLVQNSCSSISSIYKSKIEKDYSSQNSKCYKDHLNILRNQQNSQDQNTFIQDKKQKYPLRNNKQQQIKKK